MLSGMDILTARALFEGYMSVLKESGSPLYEGYTKSDMALGKYPKSINGNTKIPNPAGGVAGDCDMHMAVQCFVARAMASRLQNPDWLYEYMDDAHEKELIGLLGELPVAT